MSTEKCVSMDEYNEKMQGIVTAILMMFDGITVSQSSKVLATIIATVGSMIEQEELRMLYASEGIDAITETAKNAMAEYEAQKKA